MVLDPRFLQRRLKLPIDCYWKFATGMCPNFFLAFRKRINCRNSGVGTVTCIVYTGIKQSERSSVASPLICKAGRFRNVCLINSAKSSAYRDEKGRGKEADEIIKWARRFLIWKKIRRNSLRISAQLTALIICLYPIYFPFYYSLSPGRGKRPQYRP